MQKQIFKQIIAERQAQDKKWGEQNHNSFMWLSILMEEVGEVSKAALEAEHNQYKHTALLGEYHNELIQVAAVAIAMIECVHRNFSKLAGKDK